MFFPVFQRTARWSAALNVLYKALIRPHLFVSALFGVSGRGLAEEAEST